MTITLALTPDMAARLEAGLARGDLATVRQVLIEAVEPTLASLVRDTADEPSVEEAERLLDELAAETRVHLPPDWHGLSDYAVSRAGLYENQR